MPFDEGISARSEPRQGLLAALRLVDNKNQVTEQRHISVVLCEGNVGFTLERFRRVWKDMVTLNLPLPCTSGPSYLKKKERTAFSQLCSQIGQRNNFLVKACLDFARPLLSYASSYVGFLIIALDCQIREEASAKESTIHHLLLFEHSLWFEELWMLFLALTVKDFSKTVF